MDTLKMTLIGDRPLLMHNGQLANPRNRWARELKSLTSKRKKTDDDFEAIRRVEWFGGLYLDPQNRIAVPGDVIYSVAVEGAKKAKLGQQAKAGVDAARAFYPLKHNGPSDLDALFAIDSFCDYRNVTIGTSKTMRARPRFDEWSLPIELLVDTSLIEVRDVVAAFEAAGRQVGMGDYTPRYGRFHVEV